MPTPPPIASSPPQDPPPDEAENTSGGTGCFYLLALGLGTLGVLLAALAMACAIEGWAVKGKLPPPSEADKPPPQAQAQHLPPSPTLGISVAGIVLQISASTPPASPADTNMESEAPGPRPAPGWLGGLLNAILRRLGNCTSWLSHGLDDKAKAEVEWADTAGALGGAAATLVTLATVLIAFIQMKEQLGRTDELLHHARRERLQGDTQLAILGNQARVAALSAQLQTSRSRVETLWKGSQMDFERQARIGDGSGSGQSSEDQKELDRIISDITRGLARDDPRYIIVARAVEHWYKTSGELEEAINAWKVTAPVRQARVDAAPDLSSSAAA